MAALAAGYRHSLGLLEDGSILAWGDNNYGQNIVPIKDKKFYEIKEEIPAHTSYPYDLYDI